MNQLANKSLLFFMVFLLSGQLSAAPGPCTGPNKNDPGCNTTTATLPAVVLNSAQVDWLNEQIVVNGENFSADTTVTIAGVSATIASRSSSQLFIPMDSAIAGTLKGNHNLVVNDPPSASSSSLSLFIKASLIDSTLTGCPCELDWSNSLGGLWNPAIKSTECTEVNSGSNGTQDIAGTVYSDPNDVTVYPHYPIGAAFTAEPSESVCQLTSVDNSPASVTNLVKKRINRQQQSDCRAVLANNICSTINGNPAP